MIAILQVIAMLALVAGYLWWRGRHPYVISRQEMRTALESVLANRTPRHEWERIILKPIGRDAYLESLRRRLEQVPLKSQVEKDGALYEGEALTKVVRLLEELKTKRA